MKEYAEQLFQQHAQAGVLLDTNLLLLLIAGNAQRDLVTSFKRLNMFTLEDYDALASIVRRFERLVTTPNILTEVSNLADNLRGAHKQACLASLVDQITVLDEHYVPSESLIASTALNAFGLTDAVIAEIASRAFLVMTIDLPLYNYLCTLELPVLNFNHLRGFLWVFQHEHR